MSLQACQDVRRLFLCLAFAGMFVTGPPHLVPRFPSPACIMGCGITGAGAFSYLKSETLADVDP